ncbi:MAG: helix-turn-helix domain-containing protein [Ardenticatenaceae bacterium]|nr:helix-turn-helix domain-containing protein [Ardenticatenaceae bacterium]MCB8973412.1 helix-turn-helix domain-containing protein [Ardenticatenaceae bacterium]
MEEEWITTAEAAELSGYHVNHIRRLIRLEEIEARKFGPIWQVSNASFRLYLENARQSDDKRWGPKPEKNG